MLLDEDFLAEQDKIEKVGTIYKCDGAFKYVESYEEDEEEYEYEDEEEDEYEDEEYY